MIRSLLLLIVLLITVTTAAAQQGAGTAASIYRTTFANLGTPTNGSVRYVTDGTPNTSPCTGGGTGAFAQRTNGVWVCGSAVAAAPTDATYITQTPNAVLTNEQAMSALATGLVKNTTTTGMQSIATATDVSTPLFCSDAGANDTYACSLAPAPASYVVGTHLRFRANTANTGAASINFNSLGALTIVKVAGGITTTLADNDIRAGQWVDGVIATGSNFQIQSTLGNASEFTNSASNNVLIKSNGTNGVASQISDDGTVVQIATQAGKSTLIGGTAASGIDVGNNNLSQTRIGDFNGTANGTTLTVDDVAGEVDIVAGALSVNGTVSAGNGFTLATTGKSVASISNPAASIFIGNATNNSAQLTGTFTGNRVATFPDATGTVQLVGAANTGTILPVDMSNGVLSTATGTVYASPGTTAGLTNATESSVSFPVTRAGTISNLYVRTGGTAKVNTPATVITIRKNGVDTTVTVTMTQTVTTTTSDTTHSFTVVAGDLITLSFVTTGAAAVSTSIAGVSFEVD